MPNQIQKIIESEIKIISQIIKNDSLAIVCPDCSGGGYDYDHERNCSKCSGTGLTEWRLEYLEGQLDKKLKAIILSLLHQEIHELEGMLEQTDIGGLYWHGQPTLSDLITKKKQLVSELEK